MRRWLPLLAVCLGTLMLILDLTVVNTALPAMTAALHGSVSDLQWIVDSYAVVLAATVLGAGTVADRVGHRAGYLAGLAGFAVGSVGCGLAPTASALIELRALQALGGSLMFATTLALLRHRYDGHERRVAFAVWGGTSGAAGAVGPLVGGAVTEWLSWRWIFLLNVPLVALAVLLTLLSLERDQTTDAQRLDVPGVLTFTGFAGGLSYGLIAGEQIVLVVAAICLVGFVVWERRAAHPMLELSLLRRPAFSGTLVGGFGLNLAAFGSLPFASAWLQSGLGYGPLRTGLVGGLPYALSSGVVSIGLGRRAAESPRLAIAGGVALIGLGCGLQAVLVTHESTGVSLVPGLVISGMGIGLATPCLGSTVTASVPHRSTGMASGAMVTARQLGMSIGIAALGVLFAGSTHRDQASGLVLVLWACLAAALVCAVAAGLLLRGHASYDGVRDTPEEPRRSGDRAPSSLESSACPGSPTPAPPASATSSGVVSGASPSSSSHPRTPRASRSSGARSGSSSRSGRPSSR